MVLAAVTMYSVYNFMQPQHPLFFILEAVALDTFPVLSVPHPDSWWPETETWRLCPDWLTRLFPATPFSWHSHIFLGTSSSYLSTVWSPDAIVADLAADNRLSGQNEPSEHLGLRASPFTHNSRWWMYHMPAQVWTYQKLEPCKWDQLRWPCR